MMRKYFHDLFGGEASPGDIAETVILISNPLSSERLAQQLEGAVLAADHYEFQAYTGAWQGVRLSLCSTGLGGGSASIAMDSLAALGGKSFIFLGTGVRPTAPGQLEVATGGVRLDGASLDYVPADYPALVHSDILLALLTAARAADLSPQSGLFLSHAGPLKPGDQAEFEHYNSRHKPGAPFSNPILPSSPEVTTLLTLAGAYSLRMGAIQMMAASRAAIPQVEDTLLQVALAAALSLHDWDAVKRERGWSIMTPAAGGFAEAN